MSERVYWKDISGFEGFYKISTSGTVMSMPRKYTRHKEPSLLTQVINGHGYMQCRFSKPSGGETLRIHRLVAEHFLPLVEGKSHVNHKNGNKLDNTIENLEWCTNDENMKHANRLNLITRKRGEQTKCSKLTEQKVKEIRAAFIGVNKKELAEKYNVHKSTIEDVVNRKFWRHVL